jgi:Na+/melibiose symporter-like transporter
MKTPKENKRAEWQTNRKERISYYLGDNAKTLEGVLVTTFMTTFLLLSGINIVAVATVTLAVKIVDAFDDVIFGYLVDKLNPSQIGFLSKIGGNGKYLPWYRALFWIFPLATVLLFQMPQGLSDWAKVAYFAVFYLIYDISFTIVDIPMNSAIVTLTGNSDERNTLVTNKNIFTMVMSLIAAPVMYFLISEKVGLSVKNVVFLMSIVFVAAMLPMVFVTKEHNVNDKPEKDEKYTVKDMVRNVKNNKYLLLLLGATAVYGCCLTGDSISLFVSYYLYGDSTILLIPALVTIVPVLIAQKICERISSKYEKFHLCMIIQAVHLALRLGIYIIGYSNIVLHISLLILVAIPSIMFFMMTQYMMLDCIEYGEYKSGKECAGITFALKSFIVKATPSVASSLGLILLSLFGWVSIQAESFAEIAEKNITQPASAITGLWNVSAGPIIIGVALSIVLLFFYRLRGKDVEVMQKVNKGEMSREEAQVELSRPY